MKLFPLKQLLQFWSVRIWSTVPVLATVDYSTTGLDSLVPEHFKPIIYGLLAVVGLLARSIKQPNIK